MAIIRSIVNGLSAVKIREALNELLRDYLTTEGLYRVASIGALGIITIPAEIDHIKVLCYQNIGDAPEFRLRRLKSDPDSTKDELLKYGTLAGVYTDATGSKFIINEPVHLPEFYGAKGNGSLEGKGGIGNDDAPAFRMMSVTHAALRVKCSTIPGRAYRLGSHIAHQYGQKTCINWPSNTDFDWQSIITHDSYDAVSGAPMAMWTDGLVNRRAKNIRIVQNGGKLMFARDVTRPVRPDTGNGTSLARKGSIACYYADGVVFERIRTDGYSPTGFQITSYSSDNVVINGGFIGYEAAPEETGDDGGHIINGGKNIKIFGLVVNSGDDALSITCENGANGLTVSDWHISDIHATSFGAKIVKIDVAITAKNCVIKDGTITNVSGTIRGNITGAAMVVVCVKRNNDTAEILNNFIQDILIDKLRVNTGVYPKALPDAGSEQGSAIAVSNSDNIKITNSHVKGGWNSIVAYGGCNGGGTDATCIFETSPGTIPDLVTGLSITSIVGQSNERRRVQFSGSPDLSAIVTAITESVTRAQGYNYRYPVLNISGYTAAASLGHNGLYVIKLANDVEKWVEIDNLRPNLVSETTSVGSAKITRGHPPAMYMLDCNKTRFKGLLKNPKSHASIYVGRRNGTASVGCEVDMTVEGQTFGAGLLVEGAINGRFKVNFPDAQSGYYMIRELAVNGLTNTNNVYENSTDYAAITDSTKGFARTCYSDDATSKFGEIRGRQTTRLSGSVNQLINSDTFTILVNISTYAGPPRTAINQTHLRSLWPEANGGQILSVTYDSGTALITVKTKDPATVQTRWFYNVQPNL